MKKIPDSLIALIESGQREIATEKHILEAERRRQRAERLRKSASQVRKLWNYLCIEAKEDLADVWDYVNSEMPEGWKPSDSQWLYIRIPNCGDVVADYSKNEWGWSLRGYAVAQYHQQGDRKIRAWVFYDAMKYSLNYVLATALEQHKSAPTKDIPCPVKPVHKRYGVEITEITDDSCGLAQVVS